MTATLYTIGHSNHEPGTFATILHAYQIATLVDIRAYPQSKRYPHFSMDPLRESLQKSGIVYHWAGKHLGGMRDPAPQSKHLALKDNKMRGYADYMESDVFIKAAVQLMHLAQMNPTVVMCAERVPEHCHRYLLADYLTLQGVEVQHIISATEVQPHQLSPAARRESQELVYDRNITAALI